MKNTTNHGLHKPEPLIDNVNIDVLNENMEIVDKGLVIYLGITSGPVNTYSIASDNIKALSEGLAVCIKIHAASTAASTLNINGWGAKAIKKAGGADVTSLKAGIYTLRYDGTNFILQGEGASGDAAASDLLLGKKATTDAGEITGTIPSKVAQTYIPGAADQVIDAGQYLSGAQTIMGDPDLIPPNITEDMNFFGVQGIRKLGKKFASGTVVSSDGSTAYYFSFIGGGSYQTHRVIVSGLSFKPRVIILKCVNNQDHMTVYSETGGGLYPRTASVVITQADGTNLGCYAIKGDVSPAYVVNGGFCLPASSYGRTYTYEAWE